MPLMAGTSMVFCAAGNIRRFRAKRQRARIGLPGIDDAKGYRRRAGAVRGDKIVTVGAALFVTR